MHITRSSAVKFDIIPTPGSILICEIKLKGSKYPVKVYVDLIIYYKNPIHWHITDVTSSGVQVVDTSKEDSVHAIRLKVPYFKDRVQSFINVSVNDIQGAVIEYLTVEDEIEREIKKRKKEEEIRARKERLENKLIRIKNGEEKPDIICEGLMFGHSGFAKAMRNVTYGLDKIGCRVRAIVLDGDNIGSINTKKGKRVNELIAQREYAQILDTTFWVTMNNPMGTGTHENTYSIAYVMFETENFPVMYAEHLKKQNEVWTPSTFCKDSMMRSGLSNVIVMPLGVDTEMFDRNNVQAMDCPIGMKDKFKFLTVCGYSERKGISILVKAFTEEFNKNDNVALYIKGGWYDREKAQNEINNEIKDINNSPYIHLDFNIYPDETLARIYKMCDAFVLPTRGEGWGLPPIEAMSMELPTICTRYGGQLEFMNDDNSYLINIDGTAPEPRCNWICHEYIGGRFAVPNKDHLRQLMRHVYENKEDAMIKGKKAREYIINNFSWEKSCNRMYMRLRDIANELSEKNNSQ